MDNVASHSNTLNHNGTTKEFPVNPVSRKRSLREIRLESEAVHQLYETFLEDLRRKIENPSVDRNLLCRDFLAEIYLGKKIDYEAMMADEETPLATRLLLASFDPRNITLEPEYYAELDPEKYYPRKPLIWLWTMFDRSPLGQNLHLGVRLRRLLAGYIFKRCGKNLKIFHGVEVSFGYNLSVGDNVVFHRYTLIDDRGEVIIHDNSSLSDYVNVYSHSHNIADQNDVSLGTTEIGPNARLTYHSTVLSDIKVGNDAMVGTMGVVTRDVRPHHVNVGIPAKSVRVKPDSCTSCDEDCGRRVEPPKP
ncbi:MAG: acyltransferase [Candidatus Tectomicrobia bacterium]|uniref:Acyltransferase n=1 Tax=Tectimicrobiota bacterium TaxID=2528274 RepID=A0A932FWW8_UNCTE|nr:acyltransferase [Candidatus Tectomicrobia bacterium]